MVLGYIRKLSKYINYFSVAVTKHHDPGSLLKDEFTWDSQFQRDKSVSPSWWETWQQAGMVIRMAPESSVTSRKQREPSGDSNKLWNLMVLLEKVWRRIQNPETSVHISFKQPPEIRVWEWASNSISLWYPLQASTWALAFTPSVRDCKLFSVS